MKNLLLDAPKRMVCDPNWPPNRKGLSRNVHRKLVCDRNWPPNKKGLSRIVHQKMVCDPNLQPNRKNILQNLRTSNPEAIDIEETITSRDLMLRRDLIRVMG